ncbi:MAG: VOC family protein [Sphingomicrobium sp.]
MHVNALDHVNIITADLDATVKFYTRLLGLDRRDAPAPLRPDQAQWMYDAQGRAIFHINSIDMTRAFDRDVTPGPTGAIHHVALNCSDYPAAIARCAELGIGVVTNLVQSIGLKQLFITDPNEVVIELNFFED